MCSGSRERVFLDWSRELRADTETGEKKTENQLEKGWVEIWSFSSWPDKKESLRERERDRDWKKKRERERWRLREREIEIERE